MADQTKTVIAGGGGDYTTIQAALNAADVTSGFWKIVISDNSTYNEALTLTSVTGTPTASNYVWLTVAASNRHTGVFTGTHAILGNTGSSTGFTLEGVSYTRVEYMHFRRTGGSASAGHEITTGSFWNGSSYIDAQNTVLSHCLFGVNSPNLHGHSGISTHSDASYTTTSISIDNCEIVGNYFNNMTVGNANGGTTTINLDSCIFANSYRNTTGALYDNFNIVNNSAPDTATLNVYNCAFAHGNTGTDTRTVKLDATSGTITVNGSNNLRSNGSFTKLGSVTDNTTSWQVATSGVTSTSKSSGSWYVVVDGSSDADTGDFTLLDSGAGNLAAKNGVDRIGSEPDSRQDFSLDLAGNTRPTTNVDIGAFQVSLAGGNADGWGRIPCF